MTAVVARPGDSLRFRFTWSVAERRTPWQRGRCASQSGSDAAGSVKWYNIGGVKAGAQGDNIVKLSIELEASVSNCVEVVFGADANNDGVLDTTEAALCGLPV